MTRLVDWKSAGIEEAAFWRYVREQIFTLRGVECPEESLTVLLTGSRAIGAHTAESDVDIDVLCPDAVYCAMHQAALESGLIRAANSFFLTAPKEGWERYFGAGKGRPHFSVMRLQEVERHFREYVDVFLWVWTNAGVVHDPHGQFSGIVETFRGYPRDMLVRKIKYHVLMAWYWDVEVFPHHSRTDGKLLAASTALLNGMTELLRVFFLAEGKPYPYTEQLWPLAQATPLGRDFLDMFQRVTDLVVGNRCAEQDIFERLLDAAKMLFWSDAFEECRRLDAALDQAMLDAGVEPEWVEAGFGNIEELLSGALGPPP